MEVLKRGNVFGPWEHWDTNQPAGLFFPNSWCPPPPKWLKINVDGALIPNNAAGIGMVIRDEQGNLITANLIHWDSTAVELKAIELIDRIVEGWMLEVMGVIIEGDNASVIQFSSCKSLSTGRDGRIGLRRVISSRG